MKPIFTCLQFPFRRRPTRIAPNYRLYLQETRALLLVDVNNLELLLFTMEACEVAVFHVEHSFTWFPGHVSRGTYEPFFVDNKQGRSFPYNTRHCGEGGTTDEVISPVDETVLKE